MLSVLPQDLDIGEILESQGIGKGNRSNVSGKTDEKKNLRKEKNEALRKNNPFPFKIMDGDS